MRPGEVSKAHLGVLFMDEFPLFPSDVVEALREPLEAGEISISRGEEDALYPARAMFVFACNPCPCGKYHPYSRDHDCTCSETKRRDYRRKISGPIADRIDITRFVEPVRRGAGGAALRPAGEQRGHPGAGHRGPGPAAGALPRSAVAAQRARAGALAARARRAHRGRRASVWRVEVHAGRLTRRGAVRVHRVAWTVADLAGVDRPGPDELDVALRLRNAEPARAAQPAARPELDETRRAR